MSQNQIFCPSCGVAVSSSARFCRACGAPIGAAGVKPDSVPESRAASSGLPPAMPPPTPRSGAAPVSARKSSPALFFVIGTIALVCICLVLGIGGIAMITSGGGQTTRPTQLSSTPVAQQSLAPSTSPQTVSWNDRVSITIPGGLLTQPASVSIGIVDRPPAPRIQAVRALATYSISLDTQIQPTKPITVELAFDPKQIDSDLAVEDALSLAVWNAESGDWVAVPSLVDGRRNVVQAQIHRVSPQSPAASLRSSHNIIRAFQPQGLHETFWTLTYVARGYRNVPSPHFNIIYNPQQGIVVGGTMVMALDFSTRLGMWLEDFYTRYRQQNLPVHVWGRQFVLLGDPAGNPGSPYYYPLSYNINLPNNFANERAAQFDIAHELFHQIQHQYAWALEMPFIRTWWMDATADYAADAIALGANGTLMGEGMDARYLEQSITFLDGNTNRHAYATAHFVGYLVRRGMDFNEAFYEVTRIGPTVNLLDSYLQRRTRRDLGSYYRDFAGFLMFDSNGPESLRTMDPYQSPPNVRQDTLALTPSATLEYDFRLPEGYTARLWGVRIATDAGNPSRSVLIEALEKGGGTAVDIYLLPGNRRVPGGVAPAASLSTRGDTANVVAGGQDVVYILVSTPGNFAGSARVRISAAGVTPTPTRTPTVTVTSTPAASTPGEWVLESIIPTTEPEPDWSNGAYTNHKVSVGDGNFASSDSWKDPYHSGSRQIVCNWNSPPSYLKVGSTLSFKASCQTTDQRTGGGASAGGGGWMYWNLNPPADNLGARGGWSTKFLGDVNASTSGSETSASDSKSGSMVVPSGKKGDVLAIVGFWKGTGGQASEVYKYVYGSSATPPTRTASSSVLTPLPTLPGTVTPTPTNTRTVTPLPTSTRTMTPTPDISSAVEEFFRVFSIGTANNGASKPTTFSIAESWLVTSIHTYHWNNGKGATPGTIGLRASNGTIYGPWKATGEPGQGGIANAFWVVKPNIVIPRDTYTVLDSDPSTWAQNQETGGAGMAWGLGIRQGRR
jgi:hypothetical protein